MKRVEWLEKALEHGVTAARKRKEMEAQQALEVAPPPPPPKDPPQIIPPKKATPAPVKPYQTDEFEARRARSAAAARAAAEIAAEVAAEKRAAEVGAEAERKAKDLLAEEAAPEKDTAGPKFPPAVAHRRPEWLLASAEAETESEQTNPLIPPNGIDEWTQGNDGISLLYGEFSIMQYANLWEAWYQDVQIGEHPTFRSARDACQDVGKALNRARRHGIIENTEIEPADPEPITQKEMS